MARGPIHIEQTVHFGGIIAARELFVVVQACVWFFVVAHLRYPTVSPFEGRAHRHWDGGGKRNILVVVVPFLGQPIISVDVPSGATFWGISLEGNRHVLCFTLWQ